MKDMNPDTCHVWKKDFYLCEKGKKGFLMNTELKGGDRDKASWVLGWYMLSARTLLPGSVPLPFFPWLVTPAICTEVPLSPSVAEGSKRSSQCQVSPLNMPIHNRVLLQINL